MSAIFTSPFHAEIVQYSLHTALITVIGSNAERVRAIRSVAEYGDVCAAACLGDDTLHLFTYGDGALNFDILQRKWPYGKIILHV